jgi:asparagine synthase (glutamine-hydrolysing)
MCGIFGAFLNRPISPEFQEKATSATYALRHRGPDNQGEFSSVQSGVFFGHRRLKIIDPSQNSNQPMARGDHVICYNGEIYNFPSIKSRLRGLGRRFSSLSDTEVVVESWRQWGVEALNEFDGMFAFAIWDGQNGWLAVDPFSEKQLYYAETNDGIVFSSELPVLADFIEAKAQIEEHLPAFLTLGYIPSPNTIYPSIKRLAPASWLKIHNGKIVEGNKYWVPAAPKNQTGSLRKVDASALDEIHNILIENVESRLISDVPVCLFLSSGIDSSLIAAIAKQELNRNIDTITVAFQQGDTNNETEGAARIAQKLDLPHQIIESSENTKFTSPSGVLNAFGQPNANITISSGYQMAAMAESRGFKVGLTGLGADEVFFGYDKLSFAHRHRHLYNLPQWLRLTLAKLAFPFEHALTSANYYNEFIGVENNERLPSLKVPKMVKSLRQVPGFSAWCRKEFGSNSNPFEFSVAEFDMQNTMVNSQLPAFDICSMQASFEMRTPFLSRKLYDFMAQLDWRNMMSMGRKSILTTLLNRYLPQDMFPEKKMGFVFPLDTFINQFEFPPREFPYLPESFLHDVWTNRHNPAWRAIASRTVLMNTFYEEMKSMGRLAGD